MDLPLNHLGKGWTKRQTMAQRGGSREWLLGGSVSWNCLSVFSKEAKKTVGQRRER